MNTKRWTTTKKRSTAAEQRATAREQALEQCSQGYHTHPPTFRAGETVCTTCGMVKYCPACLSQYQLPPPLTHAFPVICSTHQKAGVQA